ncbi:MAG TPA: sigma-70 family RNA polymerase sigma factor [Steroidobacteraceae bacterium]|nr:sigma-70 family RNA polymerase sigma factor [Steroidobacteraceae bacterium]
MESSLPEQELERIRPGVLAILRASVQDRSHAEDLCAEAIRITLERLRKEPLDDPTKLDAFVAQVARNLAIAQKRKAARQRTVTGEQESVESHVDPDTDVVAEAHQRSRAAAIRQVLNELPTPRDRILLVRFYLDEEDRETICRELGLTPEHFNRVIFRARERFRALLERRYESRDLLSIGLL